MRQLWVATEYGFCNFSLRRIIPPLHSAFEKGSPWEASGNHKPVHCLLAKENMWGCGKWHQLFYKLTLHRKETNYQHKEAAQFLIDCFPWSFSMHLSPSVLRDSSDVCRDLGSVPFHGRPLVASLLWCLRAARWWPTGTHWYLGFSISVLPPFVLVLSVLWKRNSLDKFVGCLAY